MPVDRKHFFMDERIRDNHEYVQMSMIYAIKALLCQTPEHEKIGEKRYKVIKILDKIATVLIRGFYVYAAWKIAKMYLL